MRVWTGKNVITVVVIVAVGVILIKLLKEHSPYEYESERRMILSFVFVEVFTNLCFIY